MKNERNWIFFIDVNVFEDDVIQMILFDVRVYEYLYVYNEPK